MTLNSSNLAWFPFVLLPATDNHIGYMEKDPIRCSDSLEAFEEVLKIAKDQDVRTSVNELLLMIHYVYVNSHAMASDIWCGW